MNKKCVKCDTILTKSIAIFGGDGKFVAYKEPYTDLQNRKTVTEIRQNVGMSNGMLISQKISNSCRISITPDAYNRRFSRV